MQLGHFSTCWVYLSLQSFVRSHSSYTIHQKPQNQAWSLCGSFLTMSRSTLRGAKTPEGNGQRRGRVFRIYILLLGCCCCSVCKSRPTLCDPMDCSPPGLPVHHRLPELPQSHVHRVTDAIQPSHALLPPSPPAFNLSQHQGLFQ